MSDAVGSLNASLLDTHSISSVSCKNYVKYINFYLHEP